jgi:hypothetical protein
VRYSDWEQHQMDVASGEESDRWHEAKARIKEKVMAEVVKFPKQRQFTSRIASGLVDGTYNVWRIEVGKDNFELDLSDKSCALCGGFFAPVGFASFFYTEHADAWFVHEGCLKEASNWVEG